MATGQSKIYLDIEARLRGYESVQKLNEELNKTGKKADEAGDALTKAGQATGLLPSTRALNKIESLAQALDLLGKSGKATAQDIETAYQKSLATITRTGGAIAAETLAAAVGRESPAKIKAEAEAAAKAEIDAARKTAEIKQLIAQDNLDAEKRFAEQTKQIQRSSADYELAVAKSYQDQQVAAQQARVERIVRLESQANDRVLAIRDRFDKAVSARPQLVEALRKEDAVVPLGPIRESTRALAEQDKQLAKNGVTARQTAAAMRQLPAQFSDIVVSLQGGQAPLTVFLQQGAQIKDSFGGAGNAVRAFGTYVLGLVNPFTVAAAAAGTYAAVLYKAQAEQTAFARSIIYSGNAVGLTVGQLNTVSDAVAKSTGATIGSVRELVAALAQTGKVGAENIKGITEAAILLEKNGGLAIEETTNLMVALAKDPQKGLQELADKYGIVSLAIQEQAKELIKLGKEEEAVALVQKFATDELARRAKVAEESAGTMARAFKAVKEAAIGMWNSIWDVGRKDPEFLIEAANARLESLEKRKAEYDKKLLGGLSSALIADEIKKEKELIDQLAQKIKTRTDEAKAQGEATRAAKEAVTANESVNKTISEGADEQKKYNDALKEYRINVEKVQAQRKKEGLAPLTAKEIAQGEAALRKKSFGAQSVNTYKPEILAGKKELMELQFLADERKRLYNQNLVDLDDYYKGQQELIEAQAALEQKNYEAQKKRLEDEAKKFGGDPAKRQQVKDELAKLDLENYKFQNEQIAKTKALEDERLKTVRQFRIELDNINQSYLDITNQGASAEAIELRRLDIQEKYSAIQKKIIVELFQKNAINEEELGIRLEQLDAIKAQELALANLAAKQKQNQVDLTQNSVEQVQAQSELNRGLISQVEAEVRLNELKRQALLVQIATLETARDAGDLQGEALSNVTIKIAELKAQLEQTTPTVQAFGDQFKVLFQDRIAGALGDVLTRTRSFKDAFKSLLVGIAQDIIRSNINKALAGLFTAGFSGATGNLPGVVAGGAAFADGGLVNSGTSTPRADDVPAMLSRNEYVVNANAVKALGVDTMNMINRGLLPIAKFANGGFVTRSPSIPSGFSNGSQSSGMSQDVNIQVINQSSQQVKARQEQDPRTGVIQVILEDLNRGGPISRGINGITGTGRAAR